MKSFIKDTMIYGAGDFFFRLVAFAVMPIYTRYFSVAEYGTMALLVSMVDLLCAISGVGTSQSVQRFYLDKNTPAIERRELVTNGLILVLGASLFFCAALAAASTWKKDFLWDNFSISWSLIILVLMTVIPTQVLGYSKSVLRFHFSPWKFTLISFFRNGLGVALGLYFTLGAGLRVEGIFWGNWWAIVFAIPVGLWFIRHDLKISISAKWLALLFQFGYPLVFSGLAFWILSFSDRWMLGVLASNSEVGLYSIAVNIAGIAMFVSQIFSISWGPYMMRLYSGNEDYRRIIGRVLSHLFLGMVLIATGIILFSQELLMLLAPREFWVKPGVIGFLAMGVVFHACSQVTMAGIVLEKKPYLFTWGSWIAVLLNVALNFMLIPTMKAGGAAIATFITLFFLTAFYAFWTQKLHPIQVEFKRIFLSMVLMGVVLTGAEIWDAFTWTPGFFMAKISAFILVVFFSMKVSLPGRVSRRGLGLNSHLDESSARAAFEASRSL